MTSISAKVKDADRALIRRYYRRRLAEESLK